MRMTETQIQIVQGYRLQNPPPGWPAWVKKGDVIQVVTSVAHAMENAGHCTLIETVHFNTIDAPSAGKLERARDELTAAEDRQRELSAELKVQTDLVQELKHAEVGDPRSIGELELRLLAAERASSRLSRAVSTVGQRVQVRRREHGALSARSRLSQAEKLVAGKLRKICKRAALDFGPVLTEISNLYAGALLDAQASGEAVLVDRATVQPTDVLIHEMLSASAKYVAVKPAGRPLRTTTDRELVPN